MPSRRAPKEAWKVPRGLIPRLIDYVEEHGADLGFTEAFWKRCEPNVQELQQYHKHVRVLQLAASGGKVAAIARTVGVNQHSVSAWSRFEQRPKLGHYLAAFLELGKPQSRFDWLALSNSPRHAVPYEPFIQVPLAIRDWSDVEFVLRQLANPGDARVEELSYRFGFLLGMLIGDASKKRDEETHRRVELEMSMRYQTNVRIGNFMSECAHSLGLQMKREKDKAAYAGKPNGFYVWRCRASALIDWMFNVCLGLKDGELTTYDPVRMDWALEAPTEFRRGLIHGIAESDGSVSVASQTVEFWIEPDRDFFRRLLQTFGVRSFKNRQALSVTKGEVAKLGSIPPFSPDLQTARFVRFQKLLRARHIGHGRRVPREIREFIMANSRRLSVPRLSELVVDTFGVILSFEAVQRWARKARPYSEGL